MRPNFWGIKKNLGIIFAVLLVIVIGISFSRFLEVRLIKKTRKLPASISLKLFQGENPPFNFTFEYPAAWKMKEREFKDQFDMVQVIGSQDPVTRVIPGIFVKTRDVGKTIALESMADTFSKKEQQFKGFKQLYNGEITVGGVKGRRLEYQYILKLPLQSKIAKDTLLKRGEIFILRKQKLYQISFWMTEEQHKIYTPVSDHILETFKFLD
ncbi:MAG: PsbP-related protein [Candidatus Omnitrophota bacterium]|jgi:hypothetical protein